MADNNNLKKQSVQNAMMAEIIVTELEQLKSSHNHITETVDKLLLQYNDVARVIKIIDKRDESLAKILKTLLLTQERYAELLHVSMTVANEIKDINEQGIGIEPDSLNKVIRSVQEGNKPILERIRWLMYGVVFVIVIIIIISILF